MTSKPKPTALWYVSPGRCELREESLGVATAQDVVIDTLYSVVSRGTERLVCAGKVPAAVHAGMKAPFQAGEFPFPVKYGYACVGRVRQGPGELNAKLVFCLHPHQSHFIVPADSVAPIPGGVPPARAALAANMETAINAAWDSRAGIGDRVALFGLGTVGLLIGYLLSRIPGVSLVAIDPKPAARRLGEALGIRTLAELDDDDAFDVVVESSGAPSALQRAIDACALEARLVAVSWYGSEQAALALGGRFHERRLQLIASQVSRLAADRLNRWSHARRLALVFELLQDDALDAILTRDVAFDDLADVLPGWLHTEESSGSLRVVY